jgi:hypothetical protein
VAGVVPVEGVRVARMAFLLVDEVMAPCGFDGAV